ncbi:MAG: hypothetical protein P4L53_11050 [Candidatus Obscuribacterales bacterium]|nr:hypothetical protein [Candidatus Obscuribacterales bacterium]
MKSPRIMLLFVCATIPVAAQSTNSGAHSLGVYQSANNRSFVTITEPSDFASQARNWDGHWNLWGGAGFSIDWGDGSRPVPGPDMQGKGQSVASHTYRAAGTYRITANRFHPGPDDGPVTDWYATTTVTVKR